MRVSTSQQNVGLGHIREAMECCLHAAMMQEQVSHHMATAEASHALRGHMWKQLLLKGCYGCQSA